jgi:hypothetical protein
MINVEKTKKLKPPVCPYCNVLLAIIPMPSGEMDVEAVNAAIKA